MTIDAFLRKLHAQPETIEFSEVMDLINARYHYTPTAFRNGGDGDVVSNAAGTNEGSCRLFAFARANDLDEQQTLACFGKFYREDVLGNPAGSDHANIRTFMRHGWKGIVFEGEPLRAKE